MMEGRGRNRFIYKEKGSTTAVRALRDDIVGLTRKGLMP